jgi:hypothetical protein
MSSLHDQVQQQLLQIARPVVHTEKQIRKRI